MVERQQLGLLLHETKKFAFAGLSLTEGIDETKPSAAIITRRETVDCRLS